MKKSVLIQFLLLLCFCASGQPSFLQTRKERELKNLNSVLSASLDSIKRVADSLDRRSRYLEDTLARFQKAVAAKKEAEAVLSEKLSDISYSDEEKDSLLTLWYKSLYNMRVDIYSPEEISVRNFESNVSDAELVKRLSAINSFITVPFNSTVREYMIYYSEKATTAMRRIVGLSKYYFPIFEAALDRYNLPKELKYMAVVESNLKPLATSRVGAKGMWQFMYSTGRSYGLAIDSFVDERLDVEKAADAAARYLRDAYRIFHDWPLAISSYNCGPGNILKAIRYADGKTDFWSVYDYMPRETRNYVPAMVGVMYAMNYSREFGLEGEDVGMPAQVDTFMISRRLHFKQINEVVGVPMTDLELLNTQYIQEIVPGTIQHPCVLTLPYNWTPAFIENNTDSLYNHRINELMSADVLKAAAEHSERHRIAYKVRSGDNLSTIAKRNGVSVSQIKKWNNLRSDRIRAGQTLYIFRRR